jgi:superfamily II RNA helicase
MVKICSMTHYLKENEVKYKNYFEKYSYELSIFQKYAIEGIVEGNHVLITAHTGSGKTLPAEFAIEHFVSLGKKVIYTGPIKSLINQKFYDFTLKYPHISFGILTGDIKSNPQADVLIVTAEILLNKLYQNNSISHTNNSINSFEMDFQTELGCVIMDEVHYVNDCDRGHVWESTIMMLPPHVQMVMLSATIDQPEKFAYWCETKGSQPIENNIINKTVYLTNTTQRVVPLTHYSFLTVTQSIFKSVKDKTIQAEIKSLIDKPLILQDSKGKFNEEEYGKITKLMKLFDNNNVRVKRSHALNQITKYMVENEMLPALCFVLNRKQLEICAKEITTNLLEFDSKVPYIMERECENIIRKLPNYKEYLHLPEYVNMVELLKKGVAIHHAGIMPVLKEMVELLYSKGYIKLLFATETFSVGVNMPTKSVIFTSLHKFDGQNNRVLYAHEYTQMAGRAGRRGIDTVGRIFHLNNIFNPIDLTSYKTMMNGKPQTLVSKFKISFNLLLNLIDIGDNNFIQFANKSMITNDIDNYLKEIYYKINDMNNELDKFQLSISHLRTPENIVQEYLELLIKKTNSVNKKRKEIERQLEFIVDRYKFIESDKAVIIKKNNLQKELSNVQDQYNNYEKYIENNVIIVLKLLEKEGFIQSDKDVNNNSELLYTLSLKGSIASSIRETHCLVFSEIIGENKFDSFNAKQLVSIFSCFTNITVSDDCKCFIPNSQDKNVKDIVTVIQKKYINYMDKEKEYGMNSGVDYNIHFDLLDYVIKWCDCECDNDCKFLLQQLQEEKEIFLGEFVKALLKINNISCELEKIAENIGNISLLSKLKEIPILTLKYVVTNQSLYV